MPLDDIVTKRHLQKENEAYTTAKKHKNDDCPICMESGGECCTLSCGHIFHSTCIWQWMIMHKTCPVCRDGTMTCQHYKEDIHKDDPLWYIDVHHTDVSKTIVSALLNEIKATKTDLQEQQDHELAMSLVMNTVPVFLGIFQ